MRRDRLRDAAGVERDRVGLLQREGGVERLDPRPPGRAVVRSESRSGWASTGRKSPPHRPDGAVIADVVVGERLVVVPDEEPVLIPEVLDPVLKGRVVQEAEVVRPGPETVVVPEVLPVLGEVRVEERAVITAGRARRTARSASRSPIGLGAIDGRAADRHVVDADARASRRQLSVTYSMRTRTVLPPNGGAEWSAVQLDPASRRAAADVLPLASRVRAVGGQWGPVSRRCLDTRR